MKNEIFSICLDMVNRCLCWAEKNNYQTLDPWDIWDNKFGDFVRRIYFINKLISYPFLIVLYFIDIIFPGFRVFFAKPKSYPISHAQIGLSYINLWHISSDKKNIEKLVPFIKQYTEQAVPKKNQ